MALSTLNRFNPILVLNAGSSSLKYKLFKLEQNSQVPSIPCHGKFELKISNLTQEMEYNHYEHNQTEPIKVDKMNGSYSDRLDYIKCMDILFNYLLPIDASSSLSIGHRIVHGGDKYYEPQLINDDVLSVIDKYSQIAPLHNPFQLQCIQATKDLSNIDAQFAVFDTSFHSKMPEHAYKYAIDKDILSKYESMHDIEVRKYGFHGISYQFIVDNVSKYLNKSVDDLNVIAVHIGSGCSICAIKNGISIDTSMGFTPSEGLIMATRAGDVDSGLLFQLINDNNINDVESVLNKSSGLKGICGTNDMRQILNEYHESKEYELALNMFAYRIRKYIGSYYASLNSDIDALVFTGGIGENIKYPLLELILGQLSCMGLRLAENGWNDDKNSDITCWHDPSITDSTPILSIKTDEELAIFQQIQTLISETS